MPSAPNPEIRPQVAITQAHDVAEKPLLHFLRHADPAEQDDATAEGGGVKDGKCRVLIDAGSARNGKRAKPNEQCGEEAAEKGTPVIQSGDEDGHRDTRQQGVRQGANLERGFFQHHEGAGITIGESDQQRGNDGALVEGMLERFQQPIDHAHSFPSAGAAPKVSSSRASVKTSATVPNATARRRNSSTSS